jgi:hypothetical protein
VAERNDVALPTQLSEIYEQGQNVESLIKTSEQCDLCTEDACVTSLAYLRNLLSIPTNRDDLTKALNYFAKMVKWPSKSVIADRETYMLGVRASLERKNYPIIIPVISFERLRESVEWMPSTAKILSTCAEVKTQLQFVIIWLESPPDKRAVIKHKMQFLDENRSEIIRNYKTANRLQLTSRTRVDDYF